MLAHGDKTQVMQHQGDVVTGSTAAVVVNVGRTVNSENCKPGKKLKEGGVWLRVPDEICPCDAEGRDRVLPGWELTVPVDDGSGMIAQQQGAATARKVVCEADAFELLGLPWHAPQDRNCP
eukprot:jgi/Chrzof1/4558/Cz14g18080.t1